MANCKTYKLFIGSFTPCAVFHEFPLYLDVPSSDQNKKVGRIAGNSGTEHRIGIERRLLKQSSIVCTLLLLEVLLSFWIFPPLIGNRSSLITGWMVIINSSVNPMIYWLFNPKLKEELKKLLSRRSGSGMLRIPEDRIRGMVNGLRFLGRMQLMLNRSRNQSQNRPRNQSQSRLRNIEINVIQAVNMQ